MLVLLAPACPTSSWLVSAYNALACMAHVHCACMRHCAACRNSVHAAALVSMPKIKMYLCTAIALCHCRHLYVRPAAIDG